MFLQHLLLVIQCDLNLRGLPVIAIEAMILQMLFQHLALHLST